jgi:putative membrane protein
VYLTARFLDGAQLDDYTSALMMAVVLAFLNAIVKPVLTFLTIPITVMTLGFFLLVINALIIIFAEKLVPGFHVQGFFTALWFSLVLSITTGLLNFVFGVNDKEKKTEE